MSVEIRDVTTGLWLWRQPHWEWREGDDWESEVSSFVVESRGEVVLLDPLAPPPSTREVYERLDAGRRRPSSCSSPTTCVTSTPSSIGTA